MSFGARREFFFAIFERYRLAGKKEKKQILDEFCWACGYSRKYAIRLLRSGVEPRRKRPGPAAKYGEKFREILFDVWHLMNRMSAKRMIKALPMWIKFCDSEVLTPEIRELLLEISPASLDRLLRPYRKEQGKSTTRPGKWLKAKIPIEVQQRATQPGYLQVDTVAHCGTMIQGAYAHTLTVLDIFSGWTEARAIWRKDARGVLEQYLSLERSWPVMILGYASDNGGEVMNERLWRYLDQKGVQMTRGRPYKKNDQAHIEQRNNSHVRKLFGYERLEQMNLIKLMNEIYTEYWNPLNNFWFPTQKTISKERRGGRLVRKFDEPKTPYHRLMDCPKVPESMKMNLKAQYESQNPVQLSRGLEEKMKLFWKQVKTNRGVFFG